MDISDDETIVYEFDLNITDTKTETDKLLALPQTPPPASHMETDSDVEDETIVFDFDLNITDTKTETDRLLALPQTPPPASHMETDSDVEGESEGSPLHLILSESENETTPPTSPTPPAAMDATVQPLSHVPSEASATVDDDDDSSDDEHPWECTKFKRPPMTSSVQLPSPPVGKPFIPGEWGYKVRRTLPPALPERTERVMQSKPARKTMGGKKKDLCFPSWDPADFRKCKPRPTRQPVELPFPRDGKPFIPSQLGYRVRAVRRLPPPKVVISNRVRREIRETYAEVLLEHSRSTLEIPTSAINSLRQGRWPAVPDWQVRRILNDMLKQERQKKQETEEKQ